jgi:hypothetical protein
MSAMRVYETLAIPAPFARERCEPTELPNVSAWGQRRCGLGGYASIA